MKKATQKAICILLLAGSISSCETEKVLYQEIRIIDGCEYIVMNNAYGDSMTHKGDCKNKIHKCDCVEQSDTTKTNK
jgi:hypothetical protein